MTTFTKKFHRTTYDAISPLDADRSQLGKTVLITGGGSGIGFLLSESFAKAKAQRLVLAGRTKETLDKAVEQLTRQYPDTATHALVADIGDQASVARLWEQTASDGLFVDTLILNAALFFESEQIDDVLSMFNVNVNGSLRMLDHFRKQENPTSRQRMLLSVTTAGLHGYFFPLAAYGASKAAFANYTCHIADFIPEAELRIINYHPGAVYTGAVEKAGVPRTMPILDDSSLCGDMGLWLCGKQAAFLHGRVVWANWDVDELLSRKDQIEGDPTYLKVGVTGVEGFTMPGFVQFCIENPVPVKM